MKPSLPFMTVPGTTDMMVRAVDQFDAVRLAANGGVFGAGLTAMTVTNCAPERLLVDLSTITALRGISVDSGSIRIGALTTLEDLRQDAAVALHIPELVGLLPYVASVQVRNRGTLGGNIAWRNGDLVPVLTARAARLRGPALDVAIEDYEGGLIGEIVVPTSGDVGIAEKIGHRAAFSPSLVTVAATVGMAQDRIEKCRIAIGGGEPVLRLVGTEASLAGVTPASIDWQDIRARIMEEAGRGHRGRVAAGVLVHLLTERLA